MEEYMHVHQETIDKVNSEMRRRLGAGSEYDDLGYLTSVKSIKTGTPCQIQKRRKDRVLFACGRSRPFHSRPGT